MKIYKILTLIIGLAILGVSCEPIEERATLSNSFDPNSIDLQVVQATPGGNKLSIQMNSDGVAGYWDYILDIKYSDRVEVVFPFTGQHTFTYHVTTPYMNDGTPSTKTFDITKTVTVQVDVLDEPLPDAYYKLIGTNLEGKSWVFDGTGGDNGLWWYMVAPYNWEEVWWNAGGTCCPPSDVGGKMVFDLEGGPNFTYYSNAADAGTAVTGSTFAFNGDYSRLTIKGGANILGSEEGGGNNQEFEIIELTDTRMVLYVANAAWATGWLWVFKPEGA